MIVQTYSEEYLPDIIKIIGNFYEEAVSYYDRDFDPNLMIEKIKHANDEDHSNCFLMIVDGKCEGVLFGVISNSLASGTTLFQEIIWYVNKNYRRHGVRLLKKVENILHSRGVNSIIMVSLGNSKSESLEKFYQRSGYEKMETHYMRRL